jgi:hypothetical protein
MTRNIKLKNFTVNGNWIHTIHVLKHLENHLITTIALGKLVYTKYTQNVHEDLFIFGNASKKS